MEAFQLAAMSEKFDPYHVWLGIAPAEQPPHHYRLLGVSLFESNPQVIAMASQRQMAHVKMFGIGEHAEISQNILNELARAKLCLMNPKLKAGYDAALKAHLARGQAAGGLAAAAPSQPPAWPPPSPAAKPLRSWVIGSAAECDLVVDRPTVSRRHCRLTQAPRGCFLEDLNSTNGTFLNGRKVTSRVAVCRNDAIRLGHNVPMPWPEEVPPSKVRLVRIGAAPDNDVILDFPMISWHHAIIRIEGGVATIEDLGSTNGTAVGAAGRKVSQARLSAGDVVYFGSYAARAAQLLPA
jgi:pSer/pThr/pTyr-binding forkhead associated (FHA) protein